MSAQQVSQSLQTSLTSRTAPLKYCVSGTWIGLFLPHCVGRNLIQKNGHTHYNSMNSRCWKSMLLDMSTGWVVFSQDIWQAGIFRFHVLSAASVWCNPPLSWLDIPIFFVKRDQVLKQKNKCLFDPLLKTLSSIFPGYLKSRNFLLSCCTLVLWCNLPLSWWTYNYL